MKAKELEEYRRQLYSWAPLIGGWLRREAAEELARDGSPAAVGALAEAVTRSDDEQVRGIALEALRRVTNQCSIDALCAVWAATRHADLVSLLARNKWVASAPIKVRVLTALKVGRLDVMTGGEVEVVAPLVRACEGDDPTIVERAQQALRELKDEQAQQALCRLLIKRDSPVARDAAIAAGYAPKDEHQRALFYFLTEQWDRYESLDFDQHLLRAVYEAVGSRLQGRIVDGVRRSGRAKWVGVIAVGRRGQRLEKMTEEEWRTALAVLKTGNQWAAAWQLAQMAPAVWSARLLQLLKEAGWVPEREAERAGFGELVRLAEMCGGEVLGSVGLVRCRATMRGHTGSVKRLAVGPGLLASVDDAADASTVRLWRLPDGAELAVLEGQKDVVISPDGRLLATGSRDKAVRLWRLPDGAEMATLEGHKKMVWCLVISPDGRVLASGSLDKTVRLWELESLRLSFLPVVQMSLEDMAWVQEATRSDVSDVERRWLEFIGALIRWRRRFDIEVEGAPVRIPAGEFDIEIGESANQRIGEWKWVSRLVT